MAAYAFGIFPIDICVWRTMGKQKLMRALVPEEKQSDSTARLCVDGMIHGHDPVYGRKTACIFDIENCMSQGHLSLFFLCPVQPAIFTAEILLLNALFSISPIGHSLKHGNVHE